MKMDGSRTRRPWWWVGAVGSSLYLAVATASGVELLPAGATKLIGYVNWTASGQVGKALFQGLANGPSLKGHLFAGDDQLVVAGVIGADGSLVGTVAAPDGTLIGTFEGMREGETLSGSYASLSTASAVASPIESLPSEDGQSLPSENGLPVSQAWDASAQDVPFPEGTSGQ